MARRQWDFVTGRLTEEEQKAAAIWQIVGIGIHVLRSQRISRDSPMTTNYVIPAHSKHH